MLKQIKLMDVLNLEGDKAIARANHHEVHFSNIHRGRCYLRTVSLMLLRFGNLSLG